MCLLSPFCSFANELSCWNTTLATCEECSFGTFLIFGFIVALLGLTIVATNLLVLCQVVWKKNKGTYDKIKASMAVADILTGLQPLVISLYNLHWTINSTLNELGWKYGEFYGSPQAIAGGIFLLFGNSSSLYHLVFLSQQRVYAMRWPLKYRVQEARTVYIGLGIVWFLAILAAMSPAWFPDVFTSCYTPGLFLFGFCFSMLSIGGLILFSITLDVLPFLVMTCFMIYSAILIRRNVSRLKRLSGNNSDQEAHNKREASMFKTIALMQIGFTLTLVPLGVFTLFQAFIWSSSCKSWNITRLVCSYLAMTNSLVNPIIYSFRDKEFRKSVVQCFTLKKENLGQRISPLEN